MSDTVGGQSGTSGLIVGDWNGDGNLDLASANFSANQVRILSNIGGGAFISGDTVGSQLGTSALAAGDWDGDEDLDLASANFGADAVGLLKNQP